MNYWLDEHLETFVRPHLGFIPNIDGDYAIKHWLDLFKTRSVSGLVGIWKETKKLAKDRRILLPGRDVFLVEVVAKLDGSAQTDFRPELSGVVSGSGQIKDDFRNHFCVDTGYRGSVPKALKVKDWRLISLTVSFADPKKAQSERDRFQLFPRAKIGGAVLGLASALESIPKYWSTGTIDNSTKKVVQNLADESTFKMAAIVTRHVGREIIKNKLLEKK